MCVFVKEVEKNRFQLFAQGFFFIIIIFISQYFDGALFWQGICAGARARSPILGARVFKAFPTERFIPSHTLKLLSLVC